VNWLLFVKGFVEQATDNTANKKTDVTLLIILMVLDMQQKTMIVPR
jgi:hypothetical protein